VAGGGKTSHFKGSKDKLKILTAPAAV